jgi:hypothetical protein
MFTDMETLIWDLVRSFSIISCPVVDQLVHSSQPSIVYLDLRPS